MGYLKSFIAGFISTLAFHQTLLAALHALGASPRAAWSLAPTAPLGVPSVISLAFWGGVWAIALWLPMRGWQSARYWLGWLLLGALGPTLVALLVVAPLKSGSLAMAADPKLWIGGLMLNGFWGIGCAILLKLMRVRT
jgi:hypothetical protein